MIVTLKAKDYSYPTSLPEEHQPKVKPKVEVDSEDIVRAALSGTTWETLESFYMVSKSDLMRYFYIDYTRARAKFEINLNEHLLKSSSVGSSQIQKFLAGNYLGMTDKVAAVPVTETMTPSEVNERLNKLLEKLHGPKELKSVESTSRSMGEANAS
jgi:hypothetical protein